MPTNQTISELDLSAFDGHTPGPWKDRPSKYNQTVMVVQAGMPSNRVLARFDGDGDGYDKTDVANARLIAAAPALLAEVVRLKARVAELEKSNG